MGDRKEERKIEGAESGVGERGGEKGKWWSKGEREGLSIQSERGEGSERGMEGGRRKGPGGIGVNQLL